MSAVLKAEATKRQVRLARPSKGVTLDAKAAVAEALDRFPETMKHLAE